MFYVTADTCLRGGFEMDKRKWLYGLFGIFFSCLVLLPVIEIMRCLSTLKDIQCSALTAIFSQRLITCKYQYFQRSTMNPTVWCYFGSSTAQMCLILNNWKRYLCLIHMEENIAPQHQVLFLFPLCFQLPSRNSMRGFVRPSVCPSVGPSVRGDRVEK